VNDLRGSVPFELVSSRLGLYQLFDKVVATPEQCWLREIDWYRPPTAEEIRREKAKYESLRIVDPEILPGSSSAPRDMIRSEFIPVKGYWYTIYWH
jgi:hypothetical protein